MPTTATPEAVRSAADALMIEGVDPTPTAIRRRIGGGSYSTISAILKGWTAERTERLQMTVDIPAEVDAKAQEFLRTVWTAAVKDARKEADAAKETARVEIDRVSAELSDATAEIHRLEGINLTQEREIQDLNAEIRTRDLRLAVIEANADRSQAELARSLQQLEEARTALVEKAEQMGRQNGELEAMRKQLKSLQDQVATHRK